MSATATLPLPPPIVAAPAAIDTVADLLHRLGDVPPNRVLWDPIPGTATIADVIRHVDGDHKRLVELIDGTLVEKTMGSYEGIVGGVAYHFLMSFLDEHDLGVATPGDSPYRILPKQVRYPDVSFALWHKFPNRELPPDAVFSVTPDIAIEVLSESNTRREMERKRQDYFAAGVRLVWQIDPESRTAEVFTAADESISIPADGSLDGADVLPGFTISLQRLFERAGRRRKTP